VKSNFFEILFQFLPKKKKERQPPQKAANVSVVLIKSRKTISTSLKCIKYDCNVLVNFQKIILELTTVVDGCKGQVWGLKPAQGPLSSGYRKFNPGTALTRNWIKNKTWGTVQRWSSYPFMRPEVARGGREAAKQLLGRKTAKNGQFFWLKILWTHSTINSSEKYNWKFDQNSSQTTITVQTSNSSISLSVQFVRFVSLLFIVIVRIPSRKGCVTIRFHTLSLLWPVLS
jgi:hypothetical protein